MVKIANPAEYIPQPGVENQIKSISGLSLYHKEPLPCDLSDELSDIQEFKIITD